MTRRTLGRLLGSALLTMTGTALAPTAPAQGAIDDPTPRPTITLLTNPVTAGVDELVTIHGRVQDPTPQDDARVLLFDAAETDPEVASTQAADGGLWSLQARFHQTGARYAEIRYVDGDGTVISRSLTVRIQQHQVVVRMDGPLRFDAGQDVVVTGQVTDNGLPLPGAEVELVRSPDPTFSSYRTERLGSVRTGEDGRFRDARPGMSSSDFYYGATVAMSADFTVATDRISVHVDRRPVTMTMDPPPATVRAGAPFEVTVHLDDGGSPVAGAKVQQRSLDYVADEYAVTGSDGTATLRMRLRTGERPTVWFLGSPVHVETSVTGETVVTANPTTITVDAPERVEVGEPFTVSGAVSCDQLRSRDIMLSGGGRQDRVTTRPDGTFSATYSSGAGQIRLTASFRGDDVCSAAEGTDDLEVRERPSWIETTPFATAPLYRATIVTARVIGGYGNPELLVDGVSLGTFARQTDYTPRGPVGSVHTIEIRYAGDGFNAPASVSWSVTTTMAQPSLRVGAPPQFFPGEIPLDGSLVEAPPDAAVTISGPDGTRTVELDSDHHIHTAVRVPGSAVGKTLRWTVSYDGDGATAPRVSRTIVRTITPLPVSIELDEDAYHPGDRATVTIRPDEGHFASFTATRVGGGSGTSGGASAGSPARVSLDLDASAVLRLRVEDHTFGDENGTYTLDVPLPVTRRLGTSVRGPGTRVRSYLVLATSGNPAIRTTDLDAEPGLCLRTQVQRLDHEGVWRTWLTRSCDRESASGAVGFTYTGKRVAGDRFRVRSYYAQDDRFERSPSAWAYFRFR